MAVRPLQDYVLVRLDPLPQKSGAILLLHGGRVRTATVERVGPGRWVGSHRAPVGVEPGEKVAFFRENLETLQGKQVTRIVAELDENTALIRSNDILFAFHGEAHFE